MKTVILSSGDELLLGQKVDTNSAWISDQLVACGNMPLYHKTVGDCSADIASAITEAAERAQLVVVTGGLGPTDDDLTRSALAAALGQPLVLDEGALKEIQEFFRKMGREMPVQNRAQAMHPAGTRMLPNPWGTAPGIEAECHSCKIFVFPGVPREMQGMCEKYLIPWLKLQSALHQLGQRLLQG